MPLEGQLLVLAYHHRNIFSLRRNLTRSRKALVTLPSLFTRSSLVQILSLDNKGLQTLSSLGQKKIPKWYSLHPSVAACTLMGATLPLLRCMLLINRKHHESILIVQYITSMTTSLPNMEFLVLARYIRVNTIACSGFARFILRYFTAPHNSFSIFISSPANSASCMCSSKSFGSTVKKSLRVKDHVCI